MSIETLVLFLSHYKVYSNSVSIQLANCINRATKVLTSQKQMPALIFQLKGSIVLQTILLFFFFLQLIMQSYKKVNKLIRGIVIQAWI